MTQEPDDRPPARPTAEMVEVVLDLERRFEATGDRTYLIAAGVLARPRRGGRPAINDAAPIAAVLELMANGVSRAAALATVARRCGASKQAPGRWADKMRNGRLKLFR